MANFDDTYHSYALYLQQYRCPECGQSGMEQHKPECVIGKQQMANMQNVNMAVISSPELDAQIKPLFEQERLYARLKTGPWLSRLWSWLREVPLP